MILYEDALKAVLENIPAPQTIKIPIEESVGFVVSEDIVSGIDVVGYRNSAMDGFAVRVD